MLGLLNVINFIIQVVNFMKADLTIGMRKFMEKILIVEDDAVIANSIADHLKAWNYEVEVVKDFQNIIELFSDFNPHLVLLDISLPFYNGYHWCSEIRKISEVPIMFISSTSEEMNIIMAMEMGGDDFIVKPFDLNVLRSKISALIRRTYSFTNQNEFLEHRGLILNLDNNNISYQGEDVDLTKNEFRILKELMENKGKIVSRNQLMTRLWESEAFVDDNTLSVNVARLRKKLQDINLENFILTKKGLGYLVN